MWRLRHRSAQSCGDDEGSSDIWSIEEHNQDVIKQLRGKDQDAEPLR
jgi:hypothetical protein